MPEVVGFIKCPVCGAEEQELRVNKNRKLYVYCDRGCSSRFNSQKSREWLARLARGDTIFEQNLRILPIKSHSNIKQPIEIKQENGVIENGRSEESGRINTNGRTNAGLAGNTEHRQQPAGMLRGLLSDFLNDDE